MNYSVTSKVIQLSVFLFLLFTYMAVSPSLFSVAFANRTCCTDAGGGAASGSCDYCRSSGIETKNYGDSCGGASNCEVCSAQTPRSNECSSGGASGGSEGSNSAALCNYFGVSPTYATVQVGKSTTIGFTVQQGSWDQINVVNSNPAVAVTNPTQFFAKSLLNAPAAYQYYNFTVTGLKVGTVAMATDLYATYPGYLFKYCSRPFTINVIAAVTPTPAPTVKPTVAPTASPAPTTAPNACIPGARCDVVGNGRVQSGSKFVCSMPQAVTVPSGAVMSYELSCNYTNASGAVVGSAITKTTTTISGGRAVFAGIPVTQTSGKYKCAFRSCSTVSGVKTCGTWGK